MLLCRLQNRQINENGGRMTDKLSFTEFERCVERGKAIDGEQLFNLVYALHEENQQYKILTDELKRQNAKLKGRLIDLGVEYYD